MCTFPIVSRRLSLSYRSGSCWITVKAPTETVSRREPLRGQTMTMCLMTGRAAPLMESTDHLPPGPGHWRNASCPLPCLLLSLRLFRLALARPVCCTVCVWLDPYLDPSHIPDPGVSRRTPNSYSAVTSFSLPDVFGRPNLTTLRSSSAPALYSSLLSGSRRPLAPPPPHRLVFCRHHESSIHLWKFSSPWPSRPHVPCPPLRLVL